MNEVARKTGFLEKQARILFLLLSEDGGFLHPAADRAGRDAGCGDPGRVSGGGVHVSGGVADPR